MEWAERTIPVCVCVCVKSANQSEQQNNKSRSEPKRFVTQRRQWEEFMPLHDHAHSFEIQQYTYSPNGFVWNGTNLSVECHIANWRAFEL